ncbi:hypothetical protein BT69DRAFT_621328 [Atractiella rhizophila]|nr:hypothetical protein BT69DRAFT_621328 [Atractiella rhizophila]
MSTTHRHASDLSPEERKRKRAAKTNVLKQENQAFLERKKYLYSECQNAVKAIINLDTLLEPVFEHDDPSSCNGGSKTNGHIDFKKVLPTRRAIVPLSPTPLIYQKDLMFLLVIEKEIKVPNLPQSPYVEDDEYPVFEGLGEDGKGLNGVSKDGKRAMVAVHRSIFFERVSDVPCWLGEWEGEEVDGEEGEDILRLRPVWDPTTRLGSYPIFPYPVPSLSAFLYILHFIYTDTFHILAQQLLPERPEFVPRPGEQLRSLHDGTESRNSTPSSGVGQEGESQFWNMFDTIDKDVRHHYASVVKEFLWTARFLTIRSNKLWTTLTLTWKLLAHNLDEEDFQNEFWRSPPSMGRTSSSGRGYELDGWLVDLERRVDVLTLEKKRGKAEYLKAQAASQKAGTGNRRAN